MYQKDNYVGSNENASIYNGCSTQDYRDGEKTQRSSQIKGSDKRCNIYSLTLDTSYNAFFANKFIYKG